MQRFALTVILSVVFWAGYASAATTGVWNINQMGQVTLTQDGTTITGTYAGATGSSQITGTLEGYIFKGWVFENQPTSTKCGPGNAWEGTILLKFSADGRSVTGDEGDCRYSHEADGSFDLSPTSGYRSGSLLSGSPISFGQQDPGPVTGAGPALGIWANRTPGQLSISENDILSIVISLYQNDHAGVYGDWWLVILAADTGQLYHYRFDGSWKNGLNTSYQGPISDLSEVEVLNDKLYPGTYYIYFGVDTVMNGQLDMDHLYLNYLQVNVHQ